MYASTCLATWREAFKDPAQGVVDPNREVFLGNLFRDGFWRRR